MQRKNFFGGGQFAPALGRKISLRPSFMGVPQGLPPTCGANERLVVKIEGLEEKWVCEPLGGAAPAPTPPAGNPPPPAPPAAPAPACSVPEGYGPLPTGGAAVDHAVYACPMPDGTYDIINIRSFAPVLQGVSRECVDLFGDVTIKTVEDAVCGAPGQNAAPAPGACPIPEGSKYVMCPPSNGITVDYFLDGRTAAYGAGFTTMPASCKDSPNVIKVAPNSPYCGGSNVSGPGNDYPTLVACFRQAGGTGVNDAIVDIYDANHSLVKANVVVRDIATEFPGQRYIIVTDMFCSELPDFGQAVVAPAPAPPPAPAPAPQPPIQVTPPPAPPPVLGPVTLPAPPPEPGRIVVIMPPPMAQPSPCDAGAWLRQHPAAPAASSPALGTPRRVPLRRGPF